MPRNEPPMDVSRRGLEVVVDELGPARIWCENAHAVWVTLDQPRSDYLGYRGTSIGCRREQVTTPDGKPLTWEPPVIEP
jgi:hypothetical protein